MKCMAEILAIRLEAEMEYQAEQKRLDEEANLKLLERIEKTIQFCETTINKHFEEQAKRRVTNFYYDTKCVVEKDRLGNKQIILLDIDSVRYANGDISKSPSATKRYDYETLINYLAQFCYKVEFTDSSYKTYGSGSHKCLILTVKFAD